MRESAPSDENEIGPELAGRSFAASVFFLFVAAGLGFFLRHLNIKPLVGIHYGYWLHAHSHVAFLGWVFNAFFAAALMHFVPLAAAARYRILWWTMQVAVLGMLVTFPLQGYAAASIAFSTLHLVASAIFAGLLWRRNRAHASARAHLKGGLFFMLLSGVGPLALGPVVAFGFRETPAYNLAIYFYLHFQYNGWFLFFLQALVLQLAIERGLKPDTGGARAAAWSLFAGCMLTYAQSAFWLSPPEIVYAFGFAGAVLQLIGLYQLGRSLGAWREAFPETERRLWLLAAACFTLKLLLQFAGTHHAVQSLLMGRSHIIAFLHLVYLGVVTPALFAWARKVGFLSPGWAYRLGLALFLAGAAATELLLVLPTVLDLIGQPLELSYPVWLLASASLLMVGSAFLLLALRRGKLAAMPR